MWIRITIVGFECKCCKIMIEKVWEYIFRASIRSKLCFVNSSWCLIVIFNFFFLIMAQIIDMNLNWIETLFKVPFNINELLLFVNWLQFLYDCGILSKTVFNIEPIAQFARKILYSYSHYLFNKVTANYFKGEILFKKYCPINTKLI